MKRFVLVALIVMGLLAVSVVPAFALTTATVTITATPTYIAMTCDEDTWAIGVVTESSTKWWTAAGTAPDPEPFEADDMKATITNTGSVSENFNMHGHDFTGGVGWVLSEDDTPAENEISIREGITGTANEAAMVQIIHEDAEIKHDLAAAGTVKFCLEAQFGTFTDGVAKSGTLTITASQHA